MIDLLAARALMALSLAFHIVFAVIGMAMPLLMVLAEGRYLRTGNPVYLELAKRWARGVAILFAVGAVSGTVLSFELGLLWPEFMRRVGAAVGLPFALEGFAFFLEAICLGLYLYGWQRLGPRRHLLAGVGVLLAGTASAVFVVAANAWMNQPTGCRWVDGRCVDIDPVAAMANPMWWPQALHMVLAAFVAVGFGTAGVHAQLLRRHGDRELHRRALTLALWTGGIAAVLLPVSGDLLAGRVAVAQPVKFAAFEGLFETAAPAPLHLGGWPDEDAATTHWALHIPGALSLLAHGDLQAPVTGLLEFPRADWPPVAVTHLAFDLMVGLGTLLLGMALLAAWLGWRRRPLWSHGWFLRLLVWCTPLGFVAVEAGWIVTEVGRQPWIVAGQLRTSDAVTPVPNLWLPLVVFALLYLLLASVVVRLMRRHAQQSVADHG